MNRIYKSLLIALLAFGISSCKKFTEGYDISPNSPENAPTEQKVTAVETAMGLVFPGELARNAGIWTGQFTGVDRQYEGLNNYVVTAGTYDTPWGNAFQLVAAQARIIQENSETEKNYWTKGIAQVIEANMIGTATALWGDIPYTELFQPDVFPNPKFDKQRDVYASVQVLLDDAIVNMGRTGINLAERDIFYQGDLAKWIAAAHTLKARFYLHTGDYQLAVDNALLGIASPEGDMVMPFGGTAIGTDVNPYYSFIDNDRTGYMTADGAYAVNLLQGRNNAKTVETGRYNYFYTSEGDYGAPDPNYLDGAFAADADSPILTFEENQSILAESYLRLNQFANALAALNTIRASHNTDTRYLGPNKVKYDVKYLPYMEADFIAGGVLAGTSKEEALLKEILTEKYLSLLGQIEVFNDVRRAKTLAGARNVLNIPIVAGDKFPERFLISQNEVNTNTNAPSPIPGLFEPTEVNK
jgi:hypothetical protein